MNSVIDYPFDYAHITADGQVSDHQGCLHTIVVNGLTTAGDATVYDNTVTGGTVIAILHLDLTTSVSVQPITLTYDCKVDTGIYIEFDATLAADLTVTYK